MRLCFARSRITHSHPVKAFTALLADTSFTEMGEPVRSLGRPERYPEPNVEAVDK